MATTVGETQYKVSIDTKELKSGLTAVNNDIERTSGAGSKILGGIGGALKGIGKFALGAGAAITTAVGGVIATGGFDRAMNIEQAQFKLKGLGHDSESVSQIMDNALASVKGTAYGLGDAATVAASAVAAGVPAGQELERTLKLVADASAISGRDLNEMGAIFNKVAAAGKLTGQELNQLTDSGIPVIQLLSQSMGKSEEEVRKLVSAGKIGFAEFQNAIETGMGGAALTLGETFDGALANVGAAASRLGETFVTPLRQQLTPALGAMQNLLDAVGSGATEQIPALTQQIAGTVTVALNNLIQNITPIIQNLVPVAISLFKTLIKILPPLLKQIIPIVLQAAIDIAVAVGEELGNIVTMIIEVLTDNMPKLLDGAVRFFMAIVNAIPQIITSLGQNLPTIINSIVTTLTNPTFLQQMLQAGIQILMALVKAIPQIVVALAEAIPTIVDNIITFLTDPQNLLMLITAAFEVFMAIVKAIPQIIPPLIKAVGSLMSAVPRTIGTWLSKIANKMGEVIQGAVNKIGEFVGSIGKAAKNLMKGLWEGILKAKDTVVNKIKEVCEGALNAVKNFFGIKSPSRVMAQMGNYLMEGFENGIANAGAGVVAEAQRVNSAVANAFGVDDFGINPTVGTAGSFSNNTIGGTAGSRSGFGSVVVNQNVVANTPIDLQIINQRLGNAVRRATA